MYDQNETNLLSFFAFLFLIVILVAITISLNDSSIQQSREEQNMIFLEDGFAYDVNTRIIYKEHIEKNGKYSDTTSYTPHISENGNFYKYVGGKWIELTQD